MFVVCCLYGFVRNVATPSVFIAHVQKAPACMHTSARPANLTRPTGRRKTAAADVVNQRIRSSIYTSFTSSKGSASHNHLFTLDCRQSLRPVARCARQCRVILRSTTPSSPSRLEKNMLRDSKVRTAPLRRRYPCSRRCRSSVLACGHSTENASASRRALAGRCTVTAIACSRCALQEAGQHCHSVVPANIYRSSRCRTWEVLHCLFDSGAPSCVFFFQKISLFSPKN